MSFFDSDTMADLIALDQSAMPSTCSIVHTTAGPRNADGSTGPPTTTSVTTPCRITPISNPQDTPFADRLQSQQGFFINVPDGTAVAFTDTITAGPDAYEILGILGPGSYSTSVQIAARRVL